MYFYRTDGDLQIGAAFAMELLDDIKSYKER